MNYGVNKITAMLLATLLILVSFLVSTTGELGNFLITLVLFVNVAFLVRRIHTHLSSTNQDKAALVIMNLVGTFIGLFSDTKFSQEIATGFGIITMGIVLRAIQRMPIPEVLPDEDELT